MTEQRRIIARVLADSADHPDVEELYRRCAEIDQHISISTVYRTVKLFEDSGIISRHDFREGRARYEQIPDAHHDHLINLRSGEVIEFQSEEIERLQKEVARKLGYKLVDHRLELYAVPLDDEKSKTLMLRLIVVVAVFALVTLPLMPVQWAAVALKRPLRRRIPVLYHRFVCRLLGIRVRLTGAPVDDASAADRRQPFLLARHLGHHLARAGGVRRQGRDRALAVLRPARQAAALGLRRARPPPQDRRGQCRDRAAPRRGRSGAAVRRRHRGRRQPRAAVPHRADRRGRRARSPPNATAAPRSGSSRCRSPM